MACAVATGATALFLERYKQVFPATPCPPHYVRAMYAQTATDMGRPGPDYLHGFGMLDLNAAINLFDLDNGTNTRLVNSAVTATVPERYFRLTSDGIQTIKVTVCWTDDSGDVLAQQAIVNQLNLRLVRVSDQAVFLPFVLNKNQPNLPATTGVNAVDTIQQLVLQAPQAGNYLVAVSAASLSTDTSFTLASSHALTEDLAPIAVIKASSTSGTSPLSITFDATGSSDPDGSIAQYHWDFGDGASASGALAAHVYAAGSFTATLQVLDDQGASTSATVLIGVDNKPPIVSATVSPVSGTPPLTVLCSSLGSVDPDGIIVHFAWDFGDGTAATGPQVTHTFAAPGLYFVTLSATDDGGAVTRTTTPLLAGNALTVASSSFSLNFQRLGSDQFTLSSNTVNVPRDLNTAGLTGSLRLGQALYTFTLDARGRFNAPPVTGTLNCARSQLRLTLRSTNLGGALSSSKAANSNASNELVVVPIAFTLSNGFVAGSIGVPFKYTATFGKRGSGRFAK
jgi:PKD repeat protein